MRLRRFAISVIGRVQGVGFRYFTCNCARRHSLSGWVRNTGDGGVEIEAQGFESDLEQFMAHLRDGPPLARVRDLRSIEQPVMSNESSFEVRY